MSEIGNGAVVESPFALLDEQVEMLPRDAVIASQMTLGLVPEILDSVDMIVLIGEQPGVVDAHVAELRDIQNIIAAESIGIDNTVRPDLLTDDWNKRV